METVWLFFEEAIVSPRWLHRFTSIYRYTTRAYHHASTCSGTSTKIMVVFYIQLLSAFFFSLVSLIDVCISHHTASACRYLSIMLVHAALGTRIPLTLRKTACICLCWDFLALPRWALKIISGCIALDNTMLSPGGAEAACIHAGLACAAQPHDRVLSSKLTSR